MCRKRPPCRAPSLVGGASCGRDRERGVGLISAIALIVLIAVIAAAMARLVQESSATDAAGLMRVRTLAAAESGMELALNRSYAPAGVAACASHTFSFVENGLRGCSAVTTCTSTTVAAEVYYDLTSRGRCSDGAVSSSRTMLVRAMAP